MAIGKQFRFGIALALCGAVLAAALPCRPALSARPVFTNRGIGGSGGMYCPTVAPHDENFILLTCDMGGVYRSLDGGENWELVHFAQRLSEMQYAPHPVILPHRIYWITETTRLCFSDDRAETWTLLPPGPWVKHPPAPNTRNKIVSFAVLTERDERFLVSATKGVWLGKKLYWAPVSDKAGGPVLVSEGWILAAVGEGEILASKDQGESWHALAPLPGRVVALATAVDPQGQRLVMASVQGHGLYRSLDAGASWQPCKSPFENETELAIPRGQTQLVYAMQTGSVKTQQLLRSKDGGQTWSKAFRMSPSRSIWGAGPNVEQSWLQQRLQWGYYFTRNGFGIAETNHNLCFVTTQGEIYRSRDGGESWTPNFFRPLPPFEEGVDRCQSIGLEVTACYGYFFDPHDRNRTYICYADIGFARSLDEGASWSWSARGSPWPNTFYDLAFDPLVPGKLYAAASNRHEIFNFLGTSKVFPGSRVHQGGVVTSDDFGAKWETPYARKGFGALPAQVCSTVVLDPASPPENRRLYAGIYGENPEAGVYVSTDNGVSWRQPPGQPGVLPNRHVARLRLHPKTGELYCLVTGLRAPKPDYFNPEGGGIWVSGDQGKSWRHISAGQRLNRWATSFAFDPEDPAVLYATAASPQGGVGVGGVYKTTDSGKTWAQVLTDTDAYRATGISKYDHHMAVAVHPLDRNLVFVGTTLQGLLYSLDGGTRWNWCREFPFASIQSLSFDPENPDTIIIVSFGAGIFSASVKDIIKK